MADETVAAATSAAVEAPAAAQAPTQFDSWDEDGTPVISKKTEASTSTEKSAEAESADTSKETKPEDAADSAAKKTQENRRKPDAEARIKELTAREKQANEREKQSNTRVKMLEKQLEEAGAPKETKAAEPSTARQNEQKPATPEPTRPKPTLSEKLPDGTAKYASYDDFQEALIDWKVEQRQAAQQREQQVVQQQQAIGKHIEEARGRYPDFDSVANPLIHEMLQPDIPREVFAVMNDSPVLADLLYTIGGTEASKADFLEACRTNPGKAIRVALLMEQEIAKELGKGKTTETKAATGKTDSATTTTVRAPKPPSEVGGRGAVGEDAATAAAKAGDFSAFSAEQNRRALASRR